MGVTAPGPGMPKKEWAGRWGQVPWLALLSQGPRVRRGLVRWPEWEGWQEL